MNTAKKVKGMEIKIKIMQETIETKSRFTKNEKEYFKCSIVFMAELLGELISDDTLGAEYKERLNNPTRKQMVLMKKALKDLERLLQTSKEVIC